MSKPIRILVVEDSEDDAELLLRELRRAGYDPHSRRVDTAAAMSAALEQEEWDIVTADHSMPQFSSRLAMQMVREKRPDLPFIIVSGTIGEEAAVAAMRAGAQDYLIKGHLGRLAPAVDRELQDVVRRREQRALERAMLAQGEQLRIAREIQQGLFPASQLAWNNFDIAGWSVPAEATGGDYFDYIPMGEGRLGIVVGDITGHGLGASLLMAEMRACLRTLASSCAEVSEILTRANQLTHDDFGGDRFLTVLFARLCATTQTLEFLNAGHPTGYIVGRAGAVRTELRSAGLPLGMHPLSAFPPVCLVALEPGDVIILLTDGVLDAFSSPADEQGTSRVLELVHTHRARPAAAIVEEIGNAARAAAPHSGTPPDDITAVVIKVNSDGAGREAEMAV